MNVVRVDEMDIIIATKDNNIKIKQSVVNKMKGYIQFDKKSFEAGGILIGYEAVDGDIIIEYATEPYKGDNRKRKFFHRKDSKHNEILDKIWEREGKIHMYIGEWHTHPENQPEYSYQDKKNWTKISKQMSQQKEYYIHIIVGITEIRCWQYNRKCEYIIRIL